MARPASDGGPEDFSNEAPGDDQTLADGDQTLADGDQTAADSDQAASDSDQAAADSDQAASDRDLAHGGDPEVHDATREQRDRSTEKRRQGNEGRIDAASARDAVADARDMAAIARDRAAALLDLEMDARDAAWQRDEVADGGTDAAQQTSTNRQRAAADRAAAARGRALAAKDRRQAELDRKQAARDREQAREDRDTLLKQLADSEVDELTGAQTRASGLAGLDQEINRARRTTGLLSVAYVDVVGLKAINDTKGHSAGDTHLKNAVQTIRDHLRSYDLIVRIGGDEFLCLMSGASIEDARRRFHAIQDALAASPSQCEIKVGFAALAPNDSRSDLVDRADAGLSTRHGPS